MALNQAENFKGPEFNEITGALHDAGFLAQSVWGGDSKEIMDVFKSAGSSRTESMNPEINEILKPGAFELVNTSPYKSQRACSRTH